jgi:hypothetical protein
VPFPVPAEHYGAAQELLAELHAAGEGRAVEEVVGRTVRGRPIRAWTVPASEVEERRVLVFAGIHALEWISVETAAQLLRDLFVAPEPNTRVTVIPVLNVDGRLASERSVAAGTEAYFRGNGANPPVDLNRDFAWHRDAHGPWAALLPGYHATTAAPLSQPESQAIDALCARDGFDRAASLHAFGGYLYWPWAGAWERPADHADFARLGRAMEAAQGPRAYRSRQLSRWGFFFRAHGAELDHLYGEHDTRAFLIELTRSGFDWTHPRASLRDPFRWYNPEHPAQHVERGVRALRALLRTTP